MKISKILIEDKIKEKILYQHNVRASEIENVLLDNPYVLKTRENRYVAIGWDNRYVTIVFEMTDSTAFIVTAYPSTDAQRKLYKLKKGVK
jgi:uncharacterized DUF497 family protein